jgi:hypothetical protein
VFILPNASRFFQITTRKEQDNAKKI